MSFTCGAHGWRHGQSPCPQCETTDKTLPDGKNSVNLELKSGEYYRAVTTDKAEHSCLTCHRVKCICDDAKSAQGVREKWIYTSSWGQTFVFDEQQHDPGLHGELHVIEHSAYQAAIERTESHKLTIDTQLKVIEEIRKKYNEACDEWLIMNDNLKAEKLRSQKLAEALKFYQALSNIPLQAIIEAYESGGGASVFEASSSYCCKARNAIAAYEKGEL